MSLFKKEYKAKKATRPLTYDKLKEMIEEVMCTPPSNVDKVFKEYPPMPKGFDLDNHIKDGYMYTLDDSQIMCTGAGGIRDIVQSFRDSGFGDSFIAPQILVADYSKGSNSKWHRLIYVTWTPNEKMQGITNIIEALLNKDDKKQSRT